MANRHRGEIGVVLEGRERQLVLTLGALAELEDAFGVDDLVALASRFEGGRLSARDIVTIIGAGLRGAGAEISDVEVAAMRGNSAADLARIAAALIRATFSGGAGDAEEREPANPPQARAEGSPGTI